MSQFDLRTGAEIPLPMRDTGRGISRPRGLFAVVRDEVAWWHNRLAADRGQR